MKNKVFFSLGSNMGNRLENLARASLKLRSVGCGHIRSSAVYVTAPWGEPNQDDFFNMVQEMETELEPVELLEQIAAIEHSMGRVRTQRNAPRIIDIDILFFGDRVFESNELSIPHPRLHLRRFVLVPLEEIAPRLQHPVLHRNICELLAECSDAGNVQKI